MGIDELKKWYKNSRLVSDGFSIAVPVSTNIGGGTNGWVSVNVVTEDGTHVASQCRTLTQSSFLTNSQQTVNLSLIIPSNFQSGNYVVQAYVTAYFCHSFNPEYLYSNIVSQPLAVVGASSIDLSIGAISMTSTTTEADGKPSTSPDTPIEVNVPVSGTGIKAGDTRSTTVTLQYGTHTISQSITLASIAGGSRDVPFTISFVADDAGKQTLKATVDAGNALQETNMTNNTTADKLIYVLCNIGDLGHAPQFFSQADHAWASDAYGPKDDSNETMQGYGCYLSTVAMNMTAYGINKTVDGDVLNAGNLNKASKITMFHGQPTMVNNNGQVIAQGMVDYARESVLKSCLKSTGNELACYRKASASISIKPDKFIYDEAYARKQICKGNAIILSVKIPEKIVRGKVRKEHSHFVLGTGITVDQSGDLTYVIYDAGKTVGEDKKLNVEYPKLTNPINGMRPYLNTADPSMLAVHASDNIQYFLTDPNGKKVGYNTITGEKLNQIPEANYYHEFVANEDEDSDMPDLPGENILQHSIGVVDGIYKINIVGEKTGVYDLKVYSYDEDGYINKVVPYKGWIMAGQSIELSFDHTKASLIRSQLSISNAVFSNIKQPANGAAIVAGKIISSGENQKIVLSKSFTISVGSYSKTIMAQDFKKIVNNAKTSYSYAPNKKDGLSVDLDSDGEFRAHISDFELDVTVNDRKKNVEIQVDNIYGSRVLNLKCQGAVCIQGM